MRRTFPIVTVMAAAAVLSACGGTDVVVQAAVKGLSATDTASSQASSPLTGVEVHLVPYDRDVIFDSLTAAAAEPEPQVPDSLLQLQQRIADANLEYQQATQKWNQSRDSLKVLNDRLNTLSRASAEYRLLFRDFDDLETEVNRLQKEMDQSFADFSNLQKRFVSQAEQIRLRRNQWADEAFRSVDSVIDARLATMDRVELVDTTDANGIARFKKVKDGKWWVYARYELPYEELYWNVPTTPEGDVAEVQLNRQNAQTRPKL